MLVNQFHELVVHGIGPTSRALCDRLCDAVSKVISHQLSADGTQRFLSGRDLDHDVRTITVVLDHLLQASHLALESSQPTEVCCFCLRINPDCALSIVRRGLRRGTAAGRNHVERVGVLFWDVILPCHIPLPGILIPPRGIVKAIFLAVLVVRR